MQTCVTCAGRILKDQQCPPPPRAHTIHAIYRHSDFCMFNQSVRWLLDLSKQLLQKTKNCARQSRDLAAVRVYPRRYFAVVVQLLSSRLQDSHTECLGESGCSILVERPVVQPRGNHQRDQVPPRLHLSIAFSLFASQPPWFRGVRGKQQNRPQNP